jgi:hypothetical protein
MIRPDPIVPPSDVITADLERAGLLHPQTEQRRDPRLPPRTPGSERGY